MYQKYIHDSEEKKVKIRGKVELYNVNWQICTCVFLTLGGGNGLKKTACVLKLNRCGFTILGNIMLIATC